MILAQSIVKPFAPRSSYYVYASTAVLGLPHSASKLMRFQEGTV